MNIPQGTHYFIQVGAVNPEAADGTGYDWSDMPWDSDGTVWRSGRYASAADAIAQLRAAGSMETYRIVQRELNEWVKTVFEASGQFVDTSAPKSDLESSMDLDPIVFEG